MRLTNLAKTVCVAATLLVSVAQAQNETRTKVKAPQAASSSFGLKKIIPQVGVANAVIVDNYGDYAGAPNATSEPRTGFEGGILAEIGSDSALSLETGIVYQQKGVVVSKMFLGSPMTATLALDYLKVPVLAKIDFIKSSSVAPYIKLGPSFAHLVSKSIDVDYNNTTSESKDQNQFKDLAENQITAQTALGLRIGMGGSDLLLEVGYERGLTPLFKTEANDKIYTSTVGASIGLGIPL